MTKTIPASLEFVRKSLRKGEVKPWLAWYNNLDSPDRANIEALLQTSYKWMSDEAEELRKKREEYGGIDIESLKGDYFVVGAIGSSLKGKQYNDVDLIVVTNRIWRDMGSFEDVLLNLKLSQYFNYTIDPDVSLAYDTSWGRPNRTLVNLNPKQRSGKSIHLTVQPEILSEEYWRENDKEPVAVLYRMGDVTGYHDPMRKLVTGAQALNTFVKMLVGQQP